MPEAGELNEGFDLVTLREAGRSCHVRIRMKSQVNGVVAQSHEGKRHPDEALARQLELEQAVVATSA